jgi:hypothetical protein
MRRFPAPWTVEQIPGGYKVLDANGQSLAYVYGRETKADADIAKVLTLDEARRIAATSQSCRSYWAKMNRGTEERGQDSRYIRVAKSRTRPAYG